MGNVQKLVACLLTWGIAYAGPVELEMLDPRKGIVLEPLGKAVMYEKTWTVVTTITTPQWEPVLEYLRSCDENLLGVCSFRGEGAETRCKYWHSLILRDISDVEEQVNKLRGFMGKPRRRRGLVNFVGKVSKFLFGTMDDEDAENIYKRIEKLERNGAEDLELISKQMTLIKSNFETVLAPIKKIREEQEEMKKVINHFMQEYADNISKLDKETRRIRVQAETSEIMLAVVTHMQLTQKTLTHLFTLINALQQRKLHPLLLPASTLEDVYRNLTARVSLNTHLKDPAILEQTVSVDHLLLPDKILVKISIPLGKEADCTVNKIYRYPIPGDNHQFALLDIGAQYIIMNNDMQIFRPLSGEGFRQRCSSLHIPSTDVSFLCKERDPLPMGTAATDPCLAPLIRKMVSTRPNCPAQVLAHHPGLLVKMDAPNSWLFSYASRQTLQTHCRNGTMQQAIEGTGILRLNPRCAFSLGPWALPVETMETTQLREGNSSHMVIPSLQFNLDPVVNITSTLVKLNASNDPTDILDSVAQRTAELADRIHQAETRRLREDQTRHWWTNIGSSLVLTVMTLGVIGYLVIRTRRDGGNSGPRGITPKEIVISAPLPQLPTTSENDHSRVTICEGDYERPPEGRPPPPSKPMQSFKRAASIRIPRHFVEQTIPTDVSTNG